MMSCLWGIYDRPGQQLRCQLSCGQQAHPPTGPAPACTEHTKVNIYDFWIFLFMYVIQHCFICRPSDSTSVADPGCLSQIPDPNFFHPGSRISIKEFKYFNPKKLFLSSTKYDPGCTSRNRILTFYPSRIPDPGFKKAPDPGTGSATLESTVSEDAGIKPRIVAT